MVLVDSGGTQFRHSDCGKALAAATTKCMKISMANNENVYSVDVCMATNLQVADHSFTANSCHSFGRV